MENDEFKDILCTLRNWVCDYEKAGMDGIYLDLKESYMTGYKTGKPSTKAERDDHACEG